MKVFCVVGVRRSGKTTTITSLIQELRRRGYSVGTVKTIFCPTFTIEDESSNTARHSRAGAELVTAKARNQTAIITRRAMTNNEILALYHQDFVILEGDYVAPVPRIITAHREEEVAERKNDYTIAVSGRIAGERNEVLGLPAIDATRQVERLADLVEEKVFDLLPNVTPESCAQCGLSCGEMALAILRGEKKREDCPYTGESQAKLMAHGKPFLLPEAADLHSGAACQCGCHKNEKQMERKNRYDLEAPASQGLTVSLGGKAVPLTPEQQESLRAMLSGMGLQLPEEV